MQCFGYNKYPIFYNNDNHMPIITIFFPFIFIICFFKAAFLFYTRDGSESGITINKKTHKSDSHVYNLQTKAT